MFALIPSYKGAKGEAAFTLKSYPNFTDDERAIIQTRLDKMLKPLLGTLTKTLDLRCRIWSFCACDPNPIRTCSTGQSRELGIPRDGDEACPRRCARASPERFTPRLRRTRSPDGVPPADNIDAADSTDGGCADGSLASGAALHDRAPARTAVQFHRTPFPHGARASPPWLEVRARWLLGARAGRADHWEALYTMFTLQTMVGNFGGDIEAMLSCQPQQTRYTHPFLGAPTPPLPLPLALFL